MHGRNCLYKWEVSENSDVAQISVVWSVYTLEDPIEAAKCQITMFLPTDFLLNLEYLIGVTVNEHQTCEEEK